MYKVLIVEDDPLMSRMYQRVFTFEGLDVHLAGNGQVALEALKTFRPDIILADIMMPMMNGVQLLEKLKSDPTTKDIPVAMLTNLADVKTAQEAVEKGALKFFVKSKYDPTQIAMMLKEILGGKPAE